MVTLLGQSCDEKLREMCNGVVVGREGEESLGSLRSLGCFGSLRTLRLIICRCGVNSRPPDACMYGLSIPGVSLRSTLGY